MWLSWDPPLSNGGSAVMNIKLHTVRTVALAGYTLIQLPHQKILRITNGITYVIHVAAINGIGVGTYSNITVVAQAPDTHAPRNFQVMTGDREKHFWDVPLSNHWLSYRTQ